VLGGVIIYTTKNKSNIEQTRLNTTAKVQDESKQENILLPAFIKELDKKRTVEKWGYINSQGKFIINPQFMDALEFEDSGYAKVRTAGAYNFNDLVNRKGELFFNDNIKNRMIEYFDKNNSSI
jgi:hypothetical protein